MIGFLLNISKSTRTANVAAAAVVRSFPMRQTSLLPVGHAVYMFVLLVLLLPYYHFNGLKDLDTNQWNAREVRRERTAV